MEYSVLPDKDGLPSEHKPITYTEHGTRRSQDVIAHDHLFEAMRGNNDLEMGETFGSNEDIDSAAEETIWDYGGLYVVPTAAETLNFASTDANDTAAGVGGIGARTLLATVLDGNYNESEIIVSLDGTSNVTTTGTYIAVNRIAVLSAGTSKHNEGVVTATQSSSGAVLRSISAQESVSHAVIYTVPNGKRVIIQDLEFSTAKTAGGQSPKVTFTLYINSAFIGVDYVLLKDIIDTSVNDHRSFKTPITTPQIAGSTIELLASTDKDDTLAFGRFVRIRYDADPLYDLP